MDHLTIKEALPVFYDNYHLDSEGGFNESFVKVQLLKNLVIYIPNFDARRKVILKHDLHHILTGYPANMKGETEISSWELSTGCTQSWVAVVLNLLGLASGILFNLKGIWKAWYRGKSSQNLYSEKYKPENLLTQNVGSLKKELGLDKISDGNSSLVFLSFLGTLILSLLFSFVSMVFIPAVLCYSLYVKVLKLWKKP